VDEAGFEQAMQQQRQRSRGSAIGLQLHKTSGLLQAVEDMPATSLAADPRVPGFYEVQLPSAHLLKLFIDETETNQAHEGQQVAALLDRTAFYHEHGGQVSDTGRLIGANGEMRINRAGELGQHIIHEGEVISGQIAAGEEVRVEVDRERREATRRHHTATHLLQAALRKFLGDHVRQSGSLVAPDHLRFDFTHHEAVGADILEKVEDQINAWIMADLPVTCAEKPLEEAKAEGIIAVFGEKYGETVRVVRIGDVSAELCGGTHCDRTGQIGSLRITDESSVAAGIRRIEAVVGQAALQRARMLEATLTEVIQQLSTTPEELPARLAALQDQISELEKQLQQARQMQATTSIAEILDKAVSIGPIALVTAQIEGADEETLGTVADQLTAQVKNSVVCLAGTQGDGAILITKLGEDAIKQGLQAGNIMRQTAQLAGGGGGGGASFARGGGRASQIDEAFAGLRCLLEEQLAGEDSR